MYCLYFLLDSSPDCFLFSCYQFCTLPDLVRVLIFLDTFFEVIDSYPVIIYFSSSSLFLISTRSLSRFFLENRTLVSMLSSHKFAFRPMKHDKPLFNYLFWTGAMRMSQCFQNVLKDVKHTKIPEATSQFFHKLTQLTFHVDLHENFTVFSF